MARRVGLGAVSHTFFSTRRLSHVVRLSLRVALRMSPMRPSPIPRPMFHVHLHVARAIATLRLNCFSFL